MRPVNLNMPDKNGMSALHFAAAHGHEKCIILLLNRGARWGSGASLQSCTF